MSASHRAWAVAAALAFAPVASDHARVAEGAEEAARPEQRAERAVERALSRLASSAVGGLPGFPSSPGAVEALRLWAVASAHAVRPRQETAACRDAALSIAALEPPSTSYGNAVLLLALCTYRDRTADDPSLPWTKSDADAASRAAAHLVRSQLPDGGWRHSEVFGPDDRAGGVTTDMTAFATLALATAARSLGHVLDDALVRATGHLCTAHRKTECDGDAAPRTDPRYPDSAAVSERRGWGHFDGCPASTESTASAMAALGAARAVLAERRVRFDSARVLAALRSGASWLAAYGNMDGSRSFGAGPSRRRHVEFLPYGWPEVTAWWWSAASVVTMDAGLGAVDVHADGVALLAGRQSADGVWRYPSSSALPAVRGVRPEDVVSTCFAVLALTGSGLWTLPRLPDPALGAPFGADDAAARASEPALRAWTLAALGRIDRSGASDPAVAARLLAFDPAVVRHVAEAAARPGEERTAVAASVLRWAASRTAGLDAAAAPGSLLRRPGLRWDPVARRLLGVP